jgi:hypothetical protein
MRAGILIVGSLWWETRAGRNAWREARLDAQASVPVSVSIRYGRKSETRGNSFTMTFSPEHPPGKALLVPCRQSIESVANLVAEAEALWKAEAPTSKAGAISSGWGAVGAIFRSDEACYQLSNGWTAAFKERGGRALSVVNSEGALEIGQYGRIDSGTMDFDVILATATQPEKSPPSAAQVANAWLDQTGGHENYFFNNVAHGIRTPDDLDIWAKLKAADRPWLASAHYAAAIATLP